MANILIAYATANGTTKLCAERLASEWKGNVITVCDLAREAPDPAAYDLVIVGSCIRFGKLRPAARAYLGRCEAVCKTVPVGIFLCCGFSENFEEYRDKLISPALRENAFLITNFGGDLNPAGKPFFDRMVIKMARSSIIQSEIDAGEYTPVLPGIVPESIGQMASIAGKILSERNC